MIRAARAVAVAFAASTLAAAWPATGASTEIRDPLVQELLGYLESIETLSASYEQQAPNGDVVTGVMYMQRPGKVDFAENPPGDNLVVADGLWVAVIDPETGEAPRYPVGTTPLAPLLAEELTTQKNIKVVGLRRSARTILMTVVDREDEALGSLTFVFSADPYELRGWIVNDAQNQRTTIRLDIDWVNRPLDRDLFRIENYETRSSESG